MNHLQNLQCCCSGKCSKRYFTSDCQGPSAKSTDHVVAQAGVLKGTLLQTAKGKVAGINTDETWTTTRILFDTGSQRTYLTENLRKHLKLETIRTENVIINTFGTSHESKLETLDVVQLKIKHRYENRCIFIEALCYPVICKPLKNQEIAFVRSKFGNISKLELADFNENSSELPIGILVGVDYYHQFFTGKVIKNEAGPVASSSVLGWVLSGRFLCAEGSSSCLSAETHSMRCFLEQKPDENKLLREELNRFWEIETIGKSEENVIYQFENEIQFNGTRYVTKLPFKTDHDLLPDNFEVAKIRLLNLKRRLLKENIFEKYDKIFKDYEECGIIKRVPSDEIPQDPGKVHYLSHRPVLREDKETTKIRAVFDASCASNGPSLNDCLYAGPNLLAKIFDILLRFRLNYIGILADIKQAFLNVEIFAEHQKFLRFLWVDTNDPSLERTIVFQFLRVVFGITSSPFFVERHHSPSFFKI